jgi:biopolymer transport protein TolR
MKRFKERSNVGGLTITLTPLIDVALTLLVIFIVAAPMMRNAIKVQLPQTKVDEMGGTRADKELVIYLDKKGQLYLNDRPMQEAALLTALQELAKKATNKTVVVNADEGVFYGKVIRLVDHIKTIGGISCVALATEKIR